ncbi:hypothetical protein CPB84DRAFT_1746122 [Gymnopilus junonius]|uniref:Uncharacterized protein n=1 Tax=Gymnopilus junonius TaxID=109634 RepID=A0A9P5NSR7_GYMJU|nr:hypothetical protein CPB84DRAFT_1746122 [Gymnopilus junonius]
MWMHSASRVLRNLLDHLFILATLIIILLPIMILVLRAINIFWLVQLPKPILHAVEMGLGARYIGVAIAGILASSFWVIMILLMALFCGCAGFGLRPHRWRLLRNILSILFFGASGVVSWVVYVAMTPWHPESRISPEALSAPTVLKGCRQIMALKYLIIIQLCFIVICLLILIGEGYGIFEPKSDQPQPIIHHTIPPSDCERDGADEYQQAQREQALQSDLRVGANDSVLPQPDQAAKREEEPAAQLESISMVTMDGAER